MTTLNIHLFGDVRLDFDGTSSPLPMSRVGKALFGYLVLQRHRSLPRDVLADLFWGESEESKARSCLSTALWRLRSLLEPEGVSRGAYLVTSHSGDVSFNREGDYRLDVEDFERVMNPLSKSSHETLTHDRVQEAEAALSLYGGDLMEGFYDDWVPVEREKFRSYYLTTLLRLMKFFEQQGDLQQGISYGKKILEAEPLREDVHQDLIRFYLANGQRALVARQYKTCEELLESELGVQPMAETQSLYGSVAAPRGLPDYGVEEFKRPELSPESSHRAVDKLREAIRKLDAARSQLRQAVRALEFQNQDP